MDKTAKVLLLGAGKIGRLIASMLSGSGGYAVTVGDRDAAALGAISSGDIAVCPVDVNDAASLAQAVAGFDYVLNACPFTAAVAIATAARGAGAHYFDLTEDVDATRGIRALAQDAPCAFMPQCGLAPGFISVVGYDLAQGFDSVDQLHLRVGALPEFPSNALKYNLTWSTDGLINEYCNPCEALVDGQMLQVAALEGLEHFSLDGIEYEAFNTSGGLGTLCETMAGRVRNLNYRTVRYPGHAKIIRLLLDGLQLRHRRGLLRDVLESAIPVTAQDVVLIFVTASGQRDGQFTQVSYANKIYAARLGDHQWSAIQITTAAGICTAVDLHAAGKLAPTGFIRQEQMALDDFLANRFGRHLAGSQRLKSAA
ncbi:MAG: saccharopine dehydrogenase C-terminal domain-containing protein [Hyphomicrobiales bacterium]